MLQGSPRKLRCVPILGLFTALVLLATACRGVTTPTSPATETGSASVSASDHTPPRVDQAQNIQRPPYTQSTRLRFDHFSLEQGLSQSGALCMLQDRRGFVWIGTEDGLNRFDGYNFIVYRPDPQDPHSLSDGHILSMVEGRSGVLWIGTYGGGLNRYDPQTGHFDHYRNDPADPNSLSDDHVFSVYEDRTGLLWVGTRDGALNRFDPQAKQFVRYQNDPYDPHSLSQGTSLTVFEDSAGVLWVGTGGGLNRLDRETGQFVHYQNDPADPHSLSNSAVQAIYEDRSGVLWFGTAGGGLNQLDRETETFVHYQNDPGDPHSLSNDNVTSILEDSAGLLWVGTADGLNRLDLSRARALSLSKGQPKDRETGQFTRFRHDPNDPSSLSKDDVRSIIEDQAGGLWIGTYGAGLNRYDRQMERFALYQVDPHDPNSLSGNSVWTVVEDSAGVLWIGTDGQGLNRFDRAANQWRHYQNDPADLHSLSNNTVIAITEDRAGILWVGTSEGLNRFDREAERFARYQYDPANPYSLSSNTIWFIHEDRLGALWIGTTRGLNKLDRKTGQFTRYLNDPDDPHSLSDNDVGSVLEDRAGVLWFGTHRGLNRLDRDTGQFTHYQNDPDDPQSLSHDIVFSIYEDRAGTLWLGTWGGGLNRLVLSQGPEPVEGAAEGFDRQNETFAHYRVKDGLPNDVIYGILEDDRGNLWLSTNNGISRFDPRTETFKNYDVGDGLQSAEFNFNGYFKSQSGEMFFSGINGFNAFYPDRVIDNPYVPPIVLTSLTQGGQLVLSEAEGAVNFGQAVEALTQVTFEWPNNDFAFEFAALSYFQPEKNQYAYVLEGYDEGWNTIGTKRFGRYTNLPGGTYTLRLKGSNNDGVWNEDGLAVKVTIVPPFWATWWFRTIVALILAGTAVGGYRLRVRNVEARSRALERQVASRAKELAALNAIAATVSQSLELDEILDGALDKTLQVMEIESGGIYLLDEDTGVLTIAVQRGFNPQFVAEIDRLKVGEGFSGRVAQSGEALVVRNVSADPRLTRMAVREEGLHSLASVPLSSKGKALGALFAVTRGYREFTDQDVQLLTSIGHQIGVVIENARLLKVERRRAEQFRVITEVGRHLASILDIDELLGEIVRLLKETFGYHLITIGLIEPVLSEAEGGDQVVFKAGAKTDWPEPQFLPAPLKLVLSEAEGVGGRGITAWVAATGEPLLASDVSQEPRYVVWPDAAETRSELAVPLKTKSGVIGVLNVESDQLNAFDESDVEVLQSLANQAAIAIENARLYEQAQRLAVVEERGRLARELHDSVTQSLYSSTLLAEAGQRLAKAGDMERAQGYLSRLGEITQQALKEMRLLVYQLRPLALSEVGLVGALQHRLDAVERRAGVEARLVVEGQVELPATVEEELYRIAQEALNNALKHAAPTLVTVTIRADGEHVELEVADNGRGFDPQTVTNNAGIGLTSMHERAQKLGATLDVTSAPGEGTRVRVTLGGTHNA